MKPNARSAELAEAADLLTLGYDSILWCLPDGIVRLTPDDLPTLRRFLAGETDTVSFPVVVALDTDEETDGGE